MTSSIVTIVTPSYNQGHFIRATIESVLAQDYPDIEYIVMDGGSTDDTAAIVAEYGDRVIWVSEPDRGQAHAINKGFRRARGDIVAWLNSDDILLPGAVRRAVEALPRTPTAAAVYGEGYVMDRSGKITGRFPATESFNLWKLVYLSDYILQQSTFFRRDAIEAVGWLDEGLHYALDWDLLIRLGQRFGLSYTPEYLGVLREYPHAKSFAGGRERTEEIRRMLERHTGLKRAPGYWTYGMYSWQERWRRRLVTNAPAALRPFGRIVHLCAYLPAVGVVQLVRDHAQGVFPDCWASARMKWMLPRGSGEVVVQGNWPRSRRTKPILFTAIAFGRCVGEWTVQPGDFEIRFRAPDVDGALMFELRASGPAVARTARWSRAFLLRSVHWAITPE